MQKESPLQKIGKTCTYEKPRDRKQETAEIIDKGSEFKNCMAPFIKN
jgi:hypothetical protein